MRSGNWVEKMPNIILAGGFIAGMAGFADSYANMAHDTTLGIRNFLPEPIDVPDHGMSWAMGSFLADSFFRRHGRKDLADELPTVLDPSQSTEDRHKSVARLRIKIGATVGGAIMAGSFYIGAGEIGSEAVHYYYDTQEANSPEDKKEPLPLGHFDILDLTYGIGSAVAVAKLRAKNINTAVDDIEATLPKLKRNTAKKSRPTPKASKRYTPPKKHR